MMHTTKAKINLLWFIGSIVLCSCEPIYIVKYTREKNNVEYLLVKKGNRMKEYKQAELIYYYKLKKDDGTYYQYKELQDSVGLRQRVTTRRIKICNKINRLTIHQRINYSKENVDFSESILLQDSIEYFRSPLFGDFWSEQYARYDGDTLIERQNIIFQCHKIRFFFPRIPSVPQSGYNLDEGSFVQFIDNSGLTVEVKDNSGFMSVKIDTILIARNTLQLKKLIKGSVLDNVSDTIRDPILKYIRTSGLH